MDILKRIYILLLNGDGLRIREIAKELELDKSYLAEIMFSPENNFLWYQSDDSLWYAKPGAITVEKPKENKLETFENKVKTINLNRYFHDNISKSLFLYLTDMSKSPSYSNQEVLELIKRYRTNTLQYFNDSSTCQGSIFNQLSN